MEDVASRIETEAVAKQKDTEIADARKALVRAQDALAALQVQSDQRVNALEQTAAEAMEQALKDAAHRSQQQQVALEAELQQAQASHHIATDRFTIEQAAIADRAERAEYDIPYYLCCCVFPWVWLNILSLRARMCTGNEHKRRKNSLRSLEVVVRAQSRHWQSHSKVNAGLWRKQNSFEQSCRP